MAIATQLQPGSLSKWEQRNYKRFLDRRHYRRLIQGVRPTLIKKANGQPLLIHIPGAITPDICAKGRDDFRRAGRILSGHRGFNTGNIGSYHDAKLGCRQMELSPANAKRWPQVEAFIQACAAVFREEVPSKYANQQAAADATKPGWVLDGTNFTTTAVNLWDGTGRHQARTAVHRDSGDLPTGFGVISILRSGEYDGGELIFPEFGVAVDLREGDVLLADVHQLHGNAPIEPGAGPWERIATISYFRTSILRCPALNGSADLQKG